MTYRPDGESSVDVGVVGEVLESLVEAMMSLTGKYSRYVPLTWCSKKQCFQIQSPR